MTIEAEIGARIRWFRKHHGLTQAHVAEAVSARLPKSGWQHRQAVHLAEKGGRAFTAAELVAIADVLGRTAGDLFHFEIPRCAQCADEPPSGFTCNECGKIGGRADADQK